FLIPIDLGIDLATPGIDASGHARALRQTLLPQPFHYRQAANSMVTEYDQRHRRFLQAVKLLGDIPHGDQRSALDAANLVFVWFPYVDEREFFTGIDTAFYFRR